MISLILLLFVMSREYGGMATLADKKVESAALQTLVEAGAAT